MTHSGSFTVPCTPGEAFRLLAVPERFAPLLPDYESMAMVDATHFTLRTVIALGEIRGHANLNMDLRQAEAERLVDYSGEGVIAGGKLRFGLRFDIESAGAGTAVGWRGEVALEGMLAMLAGGLLETMARTNFETMAERVREHLSGAGISHAPEPSGAEDPDGIDYDI
jgi:carbon monoxide dehydrogenase subunit G